MFYLIQTCNIPILIATLPNINNGWLPNIAIILIIALMLIGLIVMALHLRYISNKYNLRNQEYDLLSKYRQLVDNMPIIYIRKKIIKDENGNITDFIFKDVNLEFEQTFECHRDDIVNKMFSQVVAQRASLGNISYQNGVICETFTIIDNQGEEQFYDKVILTNDDDTVDVFCTNVTKEYVAIRQIANQNVQTAQLNDKYKLVLSAAELIPFSLNLKTNTISYNTTYIKESLFGIEHNENIDITTECLFAMVHPDDYDQFTQSSNDLIEGNADIFGEEYRLRIADNYMWVRSFGVVGDKDTNGKATLIVGGTMIIDQRKQMETDLLDAKNKAEESNRLKSAFLANMSHEIRTPLNAIVGFSGVLATADEQDKQEYINIIETNNTLLLDLISNILDISKIESGSVDLYYSNIDLMTMFNELKNSSQMKLNSDKVSINFDDSQGNITIYSDQSRMMQVMANILNNAIKFTTQGEITFGYRLKDNKTLYIYVKDTGCGIAHEDQKTIFDRFIKLDSFSQGTGLGLSICEILVRKLGGEIGVISALNEGSEFWFTIPYTPTDDDTKGSYNIMQRTSADKMKILIAEDNASNFKLFESILRNEYTIYHAWNGAEAIELFQRYNPHMIIMDIKMPLLDGYKATLEIRKFSKTVPILAVTAHAFNDVSNTGFNDYTPKPINAKIIKEKICKILKDIIR